jgi:hypothetical protein
LWKGGLTSGGLQYQLVKSEALAAGFSDSGASSLSEAERGDSELGDFKNSLIISDSADDNGDSVSTDRRVKMLQTYCLEPRCLISLESDRGGLLVLEETSLLRTVEVNAESVLRDRNLNNYTPKHNVSTPFCYRGSARLRTYLHEEVVVKILALCVLLVLILESTSCS